jgi:hypothetical protein
MSHSVEPLFAQHLYAYGCSRRPAGVHQREYNFCKKCSNGGHSWCTTRLANDYFNGRDGLVIDDALGVRYHTSHVSCDIVC